MRRTRLSVASPTRPDRSTTPPRSMPCLGHSRRGLHLLNRSCASSASSTTARPASSDAVSRSKSRVLTMTSRSCYSSRTYHLCLGIDPDQNDLAGWVEGPDMQRPCGSTHVLNRPKPHRASGAACGQPAARVARLGETCTDNEVDQRHVHQVEGSPIGTWNSASNPAASASAQTSTRARKPWCRTVLFGARC